MGLVMAHLRVHDYTGRALTLDETLIELNQMLLWHYNAYVGHWKSSQCDNRRV